MNDPGGNWIAFASTMPIAVTYSDSSSCAYRNTHATFSTSGGMVTLNQ